MHRPRPMASMHSGWPMEAWSGMPRVRACSSRRRSSMTPSTWTSDTPPEIAAFRASDGSPLWALPTTRVPKGNPVVSGGMLFGTDISGEIRAYGSATAVAAGPTRPPGRWPARVPRPPCRIHSTIVGRYDPTKLELDRPIALAIGPNGDAYVTESNDRVSQISPDGTVVRRWGKEGSKAGEFDFVGPNIARRRQCLDRRRAGRQGVRLRQRQPPRPGLLGRRDIRSPVRQLRDGGRPVRPSVRPQRRRRRAMCTSSTTSAANLEVRPERCVRLDRRRLDG